MYAKYGDGNINIDVKLPENGIIDIPYNILWGDPSPCIPKKLILDIPFVSQSIQVNDLYKEHYKWTIYENSPFTISKTTHSNINIVYFINTMFTRDYHHILTSQMVDLVNCGILNVAKLHVVISCNPDQDVRKFIDNIIPNTEIEVYHNNLHEYYGIVKVWELAHNNPDGLTLYFHSKGITRIPNPTSDNCRTYIERMLFYNLINRWKEVITIYNTLSSINVVCAVTNKLGVAWFNIWWARNNFIINKCTIPKITKNRYYYEGWISYIYGDDELCHCQCCQSINYSTHTKYLYDRFNMMGNVNIGSTSDDDFVPQLLNRAVPKVDDCENKFFNGIRKFIV
jgi:hypothetical protein